MSLNKSMADLYKQRANKRKKPLRPEIELKKPKAEDTPIEDISDVTFDNLFGLDDAISSIKKTIDRFNVKGILNRVLLVHGSCSLGKTSLVEAAANHSKLKLVKVSLKDLMDVTLTEFKVNIEMLVRHALASQPCILFFDDLNKLESRLTELATVEKWIRRSLKEAQNLLVICSSSSLLDIRDYDNSFYKTIRLKRPSQDARTKILRQLKSKVNCELSDNDIDVIAARTPSFTAVDLENVIIIAEEESHCKPSLKICLSAVEIVKQGFAPGTHLVGEKPQVTWNDIGGLHDIRKAFVDILRCEDEDSRFAGILLHGPPGCGKTMIAKAMANEAELNFIPVKPGELFDKYLGETEKNIRRIFDEAREYEPCMIYFDEFEALCGTRGSKETGANAIQTLLAEMDGFKQRGRSFVLAATNRPDDIDPAMKRSGRLSKSIYVGPPDKNARYDILRVVSAKSGWELDSSVNLDQLAQDTDGFTGADLQYLVVAAKQNAITQAASHQKQINKKHLSAALREIKDKKNFKVDISSLN